MLRAMRGYLGNTDQEWYAFLERTAPHDEVNFWFPKSGGLLRAEPGTPFFFKLKRPHYAIAGFGWLAQTSSLPAWLAWESFGTANGAPSFDVMRRRIEHYRREPSDRTGNSMNEAQPEPDALRFHNETIFLG